jgi:hypothetical protein
MKAKSISELTHEPVGGRKEDVEAKRQAGVDLNGHSLRRRGRSKQIPFRCTPEERALLVNLGRALKCPLNDVLIKGLHLVETSVKGKTIQ